MTYEDYLDELKAIREEQSKQLVRERQLRADRYRSMDKFANETVVSVTHKQIGLTISMEVLSSELSKGGKTIKYELRFIQPHKEVMSKIKKYIDLSGYKYYEYRIHNDMCQPSYSRVKIKLKD